MKIYYCDTCNMLLRPGEISSGAITIIKERGTCLKCKAALGSPVPAQANTGAHVAGPQVVTRRPTGIVRRPSTASIRLPDTPSSSRIVPAQRSRTSSSFDQPRRMSTEKKDGPSPALLAGGAGVVIVLIVLAVVAISSNSNRQTDSKPTSELDTERIVQSTRSSTSTTPQQPASAPVRVNQPEVTAQPAVAVPPVATPVHDDIKNTTTVFLSAESQAEKDFAEMERFPGLAPDDYRGRLELTKAFLEKHGNAIIAARARVMKRDLESRISAPVATSSVVDQSTNPFTAKPPEPANTAVAVSQDISKRRAEMKAALSPYAARIGGLQKATQLISEHKEKYANGRFEEIASMLQKNITSLGNVSSKVDQELVRFLRQEIKDLNELQQLYRAALTGVAKLVGQDLSLMNGKWSGKVSGKPGNVALKIKNGPEIPINASHLSPEDVEQHATQLENPLDDLRLRGFFAMALGRYEDAMQKFIAMGLAGATKDLVDGYIERLEIRIGPANLLRAYDLWRKALEALERDDWLEMSKLLNEFEKLEAVSNVYLGNELTELRKLETMVKHGLKAQYFNNPTLTGPPVLKRIDPNIDFDWGGRSPAEGVPHDRFSVRWEGMLLVPRDGHYEFLIKSDDGSNVLINDKISVGSFGFIPVNQTFSVSLQKGTIPIKVEFCEKEGGASCQLFWKPPGAATHMIIPPEAYIFMPD